MKELNLQTLRFDCQCPNCKKWWTCSKDDLKSEVVKVMVPMHPGNLGFDLPRADKQIITEPGDLVLYQWNQISLFYNSNSWSYTRRWKVQMDSKETLEEILWDWDVTLTFSLK